MGQIHVGNRFKQPLQINASGKGSVKHKTRSIQLTIGSQSS